MEHDSRAHGFDRGEPKASYIALAMGATIVFIVASIFAIQFYFDKVKEQQVYVKVMDPESPELIDQRSREQRELHSYQFIDRDRGVVRLPIGRAMELLAAEAAAGKLRYPSQPVPVKKPEPPGGLNAPPAK